MTIRLNGQTSGYVELEAPATAGSNTLVLPTNNGTSGQYLQTNGSGALSWQTLPAAGKLIKYERSSGYNTQESGNSTSWTDTGFTATFTPTSSSNKVLIVLSPVHVTSRDGQSTNVDIARTIGATTTQLGVNQEGAGAGLGGAYSSYYVDTRNTIVYQDSPNTTSQITYRVVWRVGGGANTKYIFSSGLVAYFHFFEIAS